MAGKILMIVFLVLMVTYVALKIVELIKKHHDKKKKAALEKEEKKNVGSADPWCTARVPVDEEPKK